MDINKYVPVGEARKRLKVRRQRVYELIELGRLPGSFNWHGVWVVPTDAITDRLLLLEAREQKREVAQ